MKRLNHLGLLLLVLFMALSCSQSKETAYELRSFQTISLIGDSLMIPSRSEEQLARLQENLDKAQADFKNDPSEMNTIWLGRRYAYLSDYLKAIDVFTEGIQRFPESYKLYRHRGHRHISLRQFDKAIADYQKAYELMPKDTLEIEPDGAPNKLNIPLSNTQFNVMYHYGLAHYLKEEFKEAEDIYRQCMDYSDNPDLVVATADWLYMTLRRQGKEEEAMALLESLDFEVEIIENDSYFKRLKMYKGELAAEELLEGSGDDIALSLATQGYGLANWYLYNGDTAKAKAMLEKVTKGSSWAAFGFIASEADLHRLNH